MSTFFFTLKPYTLLNVKIQRRKMMLHYDMIIIHYDIYSL